MLQEKTMNLSVHSEQAHSLAVCSVLRLFFSIEPRKLVIRIMYLISIIVALTMFSLIANSSALRVVVRLAMALENDNCCSGPQEYIVETACMFLGSLALVLVTTIRIEEEEEASRCRQSRDSRWDL